MTTNHRTISLWGLTLPMPRWAIACFGAIAVVGVGGVVYQTVFGTDDLVTLQQANDALAMEIAEYNLHIFEVPEREAELFDDARGLLAVRVYADGCLLIQRRSATVAVTRMIPDLTRTDLDDDAIPARGAVSGWGVPSAFAAEGQRLNPHPGKFETARDNREGCTVKVWRRWPDRCEHWQNLNVCNGAWDTNRDGSPRVHWVRYVH